MTFRVGTKVVFLGFLSKQTVWDEKLPEEGCVYTIRGIHPSIRWPGDTVLLLDEIVNAPRRYLQYFGEMRFRASRFRPVVERKTEVSFTVGADPETEQFDNRRKSPAKVGV